MKLKDLYLFCATTPILYGTWSLIWYILTKRGFRLNRNEDESYFKYCCRVYGENIIWRIRQKLKMKWFYESRLFRIFIILRGVFLVLFGFGMYILYFYVKSSPYGAFFEIEL